MTADAAHLEELDARYRNKISKGLKAALYLAILTLAEYIIAVVLDEPLVWLVPFVLAKGYVIMDTFMHVHSLFRAEEH